MSARSAPDVGGERAVMGGDEELTVGRAARLVGVSVRTLHHWDEIGLVTPSDRSWAGYRLYSSDDIARLHRVLVYRETGMSLDQVAAVLDDPGTDAVAHLARQRDLLVARIAHLQRMVRAVDTMMDRERTMRSAMNGTANGMANGVLTAAQRAEIMGDRWDPAWEEEAEQRWGRTEDWEACASRLASRTPEQFRADMARIEEVERACAEAMRQGVRPGSQRANALVEEHRASLSWFDLTRAKQVIIARGYLADPRFTAHYDAVAPGLAAWLTESVEASARAHGIDPDTVQWG